ncbi:MAG TPA: phosphopantetheine-binding protein, partial [Planctomycetota bacterium]|nr:phosphopantetheine-binding protein [Planctomycetota bacterium]
VPRAGLMPAAGALREHLRANLPDYMIPQHFVELASLPLLPNGKLDRKSLPAPEAGSAPAGDQAPRNETEAALAAIWAEVLGLEQVGVEDNFFDLGGHSLLAVKVHRDVQQKIGRQFSITALFQYPTVRALATALGGGAGPGRVEESGARGEARRASLLHRQRVRPQR